MERSNGSLTSRERRIVVAVGIVGLIIVLPALVGLGLRWAQGDTVLAGVSVEGEPVGGVTRDQLVAVVEDLAADRREATVTVVAEDEQVVSDRGTVGVQVGVDRTVDRAWSLGRRGIRQAWWDQLRALVGHEWALTIDETIDGDRLQSWADEAAHELSEEARPADLELVAGDDPDAAEVAVTEPRPARTVDGDDIAAALAEELPAPGPVTVEVPVAISPPRITQEDLEAVRSAAAHAVAAPVLLSNPAEGEDLRLEPADLARLLRVETDEDVEEGARLRLTTDGDRLRERLGDDGVAALEQRPVDASYEIVGAEVELSPGAAGFTPDLEAAAAEVLALARQEPDAPREGELPGEQVDPEVTVDDIDVREQVSSFTTDLVPGQPRNHNIQLGADLLDGATMQPGERFSLNEAIGPRTRDRGFVENGFIDADGELVSVVGGGSSQIGTTFMNAAWFAGIELVEFQPHSLYFPRYPEGREATLSYNTIDVVVENDSPHQIVVGAEATESRLTVRFFSTSWAEVETTSGEPYDIQPGEIRDGFTIEFGRTITYPDGSTRREDHVHTYQPQG